MMKILTVALLALAVTAPAAQATLGGDPESTDLPAVVRSASFAPAVCTKKVCRVRATCPPEGGGFEGQLAGLPPAIGPTGPDECDFELDLFAKGLGRLNRLAFGLEDRFGWEDNPRGSGPDDRADIEPGTTEMTTWPVTSFGRKSITRALRAGKRKFRGQWETTAFFRVLWDLGEGLYPGSYFGHRFGPIRIKLKG